MHITRRTLLLTAAALPIAGAAFAAEPPVYNLDGLAIQGYDAVAYFDGNGPVEGSADFTHDWMGSTWRFASASNRDAFAADPQAWAPQYGGYCAYAVSRGYTASTDPSAWSLYEGKLYLNYSRSVRLLWATNKSGNVAAGDANWPAVLSR